MRSPQPQFAETLAAPAAPSPMAEVVLGRDSLVADEFRLLASKVRLIVEKQPFNCIGVVSATPGEGKSTLSLGLSAALAQQSGHRVLLVEADLHRPALETYLGFPRAAGVGDWLAGSPGSLPSRMVAPAGFFLVSCGRTSLAQRGMLRSDRMAGLLESARGSYDTVIVDCPPLTPVADAVLLADFLDGFLLVVRARHTPREVIVRAVGRLKPGRIAGVVFIDKAAIIPSRYSYDYRQYGGASADNRGFDRERRAQYRAPDKSGEHARLP